MFSDALVTSNANVKIKRFGFELLSLSEFIISVSTGLECFCACDRNGHMKRSASVHAQSRSSSNAVMMSLCLIISIPVICANKKTRRSQYKVNLDKASRLHGTGGSTYSLSLATLLLHFAGDLSLLKHTDLLGLRLGFLWRL